jgi:diguanylate cyclase (GGDEF)-like protein
MGCYISRLFITCVRNHVSNSVDLPTQNARIRADESQANAELRQAFANHLPRRIELIQKRVIRLIKGSFDINAITVLLQEVQALGGTSGKYGFMGPSEKLFALEQRLETITHDAIELSAERKEELDQLSAALSRAGQAEIKIVVHTSDFAPDLAAIKTYGYSAPPADFWRRFSTEEIAPANSDDFGFGLKPAQDGLVISDRSGDIAVSPHSHVVVSVDEFEQDDRLDLSLEPNYHTDGPSLAEKPSALPSSDEDMFGDSLAISTASSAALGAPSAAPASASISAAAEEEFELDIDMPQVSPNRWHGGQVAPTQPAAAPAITLISRTRRVFYLAPESAYFRQLSSRLQSQELSVDRIESMEELVDTLSSMTADLVVIDGAFSAAIESVGDFLKTLRQRVNTKMPIVAFADANDLSTRIRALRAGVDVLLPTRFTVEEAFDKIKEQLDGDHLVDYRIMIVEDDRSQALFAESVLRKAGMETLAVTDPLNTLEALERFKPDLILMDLYMPGIDGIELTAIIREREEFISTPIVFLSGEQDSDKQFDAIHAGGDDFLSKPIRPKHLISSVSNRARRARLLRARREGKTRDGESGLFDRVVLIEKLSESLIVEDRSASVGGVILIDIDQGPELRVKIGMIGLDQVINHLGVQLKAHLRDREIAARFGDNSILILTQQRNTSEMMQFAQSMRKLAANNPAQIDDASIHLDLSAGICGFAQNISEASEMIHCVESALQAARDTEFTQRVVRYEPSQVVLSPAEQLAATIRTALAEDGFQLMFQPVVSLAGSSEEHYEVMLRLRDRDGTMYGANAVFEAASTMGLTAEIDRWALSKCLSTLDEQRRKGKSNLRLFVNQSVASLSDPYRIAWLRQSLETRRIDPSSICLEFTLSAVMSQLKQAVSFFQAAHALGVKLTLDNFENSLSALQMLSYLPVDHIKLSERYLQADVGQREELRALIAAARDGKRKVIASRVEDAKAAAALWAMGVDYIQGNFVQQPGTELGFDFRSSAL